MKLTLKNLTLSVVACTLLVGCGGGGSSSSSGSSSGTLVDPYIVGAKLYWDKNNNNAVDSGEAISSATDANGKYTFSVAVPDGAVVRMHPSFKGTHNGVDFTGELSAKMSSTGIVSPLTTLETKGFSDTEIISLLNTAGITISASDIHSDPMEGMTSSKTTATDSELKRIRAAVALNTFFAMTGYGINKSTINSTTNKANLKKACDLIKKSINPSNISSSAPVTTVLKVGISISDYLVKTTAKAGNTTELDAFVNNTGSKMTKAIAKLANAIATDSSKAYSFKGFDSSGNALTTVAKSLKGRVVDNAIPYANVKLYKSATHNAANLLEVVKADSQGNFKLDTDWSSLADNDLLNIVAQDPNDAKNIFKSVLATGKKMKTVAAAGKITSNEIPDVAVSNVTTAKVAIAQKSATSIDPLTYEKVMEDKGTVVMAIAAAIKEKVDNKKPIKVTGQTTNPDTTTFATEAVAAFNTKVTNGSTADLNAQIANFVTGVDKTKLKAMQADMVDETKNPELAKNTIKPGLQNHQLKPGKYIGIELATRHYVDRETMTSVHPKTYWGVIDKLRVSLAKEIDIKSNNTLRYGEADRISYSNFKDGRFTIKDLDAVTNGATCDNSSHNYYDYKGYTLSFGSSGNIAVAEVDSSIDYTIVKDSSNHLSLSGYGVEKYNYSACNTSNKVDTSKNNAFINGSNAKVDASSSADSQYQDWNLVDQKVLTTVSTIISNDNVYAVSTVTGSGKKFKLLAPDGTWKDVTLSLSSSSKGTFAVKSNETITIGGNDLPRSFALEIASDVYDSNDNMIFPASKDKADLITGSVQVSGASADTLKNTSFFKDGLLYLEVSANNTNGGYKYYVIDIVSNTGFAFTPYYQIRLDSSGNKVSSGGSLYWTCQRTKINFVK
jgi:hypothetical protein